VCQANNSSVYQQIPFTLCNLNSLQPFSILSHILSTDRNYVNNLPHTARPFKGSHSSRFPQPNPIYFNSHPVAPPSHTATDYTQPITLHPPSRCKRRVLMTVSVVARHCSRHSTGRVCVCIALYLLNCWTAGSSHFVRCPVGN
jgi:hypothetical protein